MEKNKKQPVAVLVGRFCPLHIGHEWIINEMLKDFGLKNSLVIIGSVNNPPSLRYIFSYRERRGFVKKIFPKVKIIGLPDFFKLDDWLLVLDDLLKISFPSSKKSDFIFFGGSKSDINYFIKKGYRTHIYDRLVRQEISATEVRARLLTKKSINGLVNPMIVKDVLKTFEKKRRYLN